MTFKDLLKKHLKEDSEDYSVLSSLNKDILDDDFEGNDNDYEIHFKSCSLDNVNELLNDDDYPLGVLTVFDQVSGSFNLTDLKLVFVTFCNSKLDYLEFGNNIKDVTIYDSTVDLLHFKECDSIDFIGLFGSKIDHLIVGECKLGDTDIKKCELNKIEIFDSSFQSLLVRESNINNCDNFKEFKEVIFTRDNLNKESNDRGLASMYDTGLFDFKIK